MDTSFHLIFTQSLWDRLLIGHLFVGIEEHWASLELAKRTLGEHLSKVLVLSELADGTLDGLQWYRPNPDSRDGDLVES